jgi:ankyrin repeat protein
MESSNHPISKESDTMSISISSKRSTRTTSIASYKDTFRNILRRESRTPSCISEIVSLLGRFSLQESRSSICHSVLQTSDQNDPTIGEIFPSQSVLEPQLLGFEDIPLHQPTNCLSEVLQQHVETVRKPNTALLTTCRGCLETNDCIHQEIIRATLSVTDASITLPLMLRSDRTTCVYTEADCYGNNALFFAARTAAPLSVLLQIIENTLDLNALNNDGHNLLFVLDPHGFNVSISESLEFLTLINRLEQRQFNFDHLDYNGQSFLVLLCLRPCFRMSWITLLFEQGQTWQRRIEVLAQQKDSAGNYLVRYLTENPDLRILHPNVLSIISSPKNMNKQSYKDRTILHEQVVQHLVTYALEFPEQRPTELPMYAFEWDGCNINGYDDERHTPLTLFLTKALHGASRISRNFVISQIQELVKLGANINYRCLNGDTLLHIAARKSDFQIMNYLTASGIYVNHQNNEGLRAIDCLAVVVCATAKPSMSGRTTSTIANLRCSFLLLRHGSMSCSMLT